MTPAGVVDSRSFRMRARVTPAAPERSRVPDRLDNGRREPLEVVCAALGSRGAGLVLDVRMGGLDVDQIWTQNQHH